MKKPGMVYSMIEEIVPNGERIEFFGTAYSFRNYWTTIGTEVNDICFNN